jgi:lipopolysaccharide export system protein LptA
MPINVRNLRRWFALAIILMIAIVTGMYLYARWRVQSALKKVPEKIGLEIQQSAEGFSVSKSEQGRTIFTARAAKAIQFRQGGRAELHQVTITVYGRDSSRFDQIYGDQFEYDPKSGDISANGEVQIDLEANPAGIANPDQAPPRELKNPIHVRTRGLVFNQKSGDAYTRHKVEFNTPQVNGWAQGATYSSRTSTLHLVSQILVNVTGPSASRLTAASGRITKEPRRVVLDRVDLQRGTQRIQSNRATLFLNQKNLMEKVLAEGDVRIAASGQTGVKATGDQAELLFAADQKNTLRSAALSGHVLIEATGAQPLAATAGRVTVNFSGRNLVASARAEENVRILQKPSASGNAQQVELTAPRIDFAVAEGRRLENAVTSGAAQITLTPLDSPDQPTRVTAGVFTARFDNNHLTSLHGAPDAAITSTIPGRPDRVSTSQTLDVTFKPQGGVDVLRQDGGVHYRDGEREAWAEHARYLAAGSMLILTGSPRLVSQGLTVTAPTLRLDRRSGQAFAEGGVKSTYSDLKPQPGGALLASGDPIHVTARAMHAERASGIATYSGDARLWQGPNAIQAATIQFDKEHRKVTAQAGPGKKVATVLSQTAPDGKTVLVTIASGGLTYVDSEHQVHFEDGVLMRSADAIITADKLDVFLAPNSQPDTQQQLGTAGRLEKVVAQGHVTVQQPDRRATSDQLTYTAAEDKFVMTGGRPSIFDAERGQVTGDSLTFFRRDDRVIVEGTDSSPTVTRTRVAR